MNGTIIVEVLERFLDGVNHKRREHPMGDYGVGMATIEGWSEWRDQMETVRGRIEMPIHVPQIRRFWEETNR